MIATVYDRAAEAASQPVTCRIGLLGLGNVGSRFAFPSIAEEAQS